MDKNMNMHGIGRRMPYRVPEGVFDEIERNVLSATGCARKERGRLRTAGIALAAAASLTLAVLFVWQPRMSTPDTFAQVRQAFENLDSADRTFLSEIYDEDTFINTNY